MANGRVERFLFLGVLAGLSIRPALSEGTRVWEQSKFEDFSKGTAHGVALSSQGGLALAPLFKLLATTPSTYIWAVVSDQSGNLYAAAGAPARIYRITPEGAVEAIFEPHELQVQSLVIDGKGVLYAATNPDGKVYRIANRAPSASHPAKPGADAAKVASDSPWSSAVYFDPGTKYIWNMTLDLESNLYVATGDQGQIFRVTPQGEHSLFFKSDEAHIRALAFDSEHNLIAGSDGSGLIYRIRGNGEGFVLYSAPKKEITALATDEAGNIYAAGVGEKKAAAGSSLSFLPLPTPGPILAPSQPPGAGPSGPPATFSFGSITANPASAAAGGSEIYRVAPDGSPSRIWSSADNLVYALAFDRAGHLLAGTGNHGHVFSIDGGDEYTDLFKANASQVTAFAPNPGGGLYAVTSNLGKAFVLGATSEPEGSYESDVFDAHIFSRWGRVELRSTGKVELWARSGNVDNPDRNWSPWRKIELERDAMVGAPPARFVEWKAVLRAGDPAPSLESVTLHYLPKNVAPEVEEITIQPGSRYPSSAKIAGGGEMGAGAQHADAPPATVHDRDSIGVRWLAHDENDDQMVYAIYYRGDREQRWLLLKDNIADKFYSFDASLLPDGGYTVKVIASDAPSHPPGQALTGEKQSARFEVDTTPPELLDLHAALEAGPKGHPPMLRVRFRASDGFSSIARAEYSVDASDWQLVEPVGQLSDAKREDYDFQLVLPASDPSGSPHAPQAPGAAVPATPALGVIEHVIVVRVWDRYGNMSSAKAVIGGNRVP